MAEGAVPQDATTAPEAPGHAVYTKTELLRELRQGEIISDLTQYVYDPVGQGAVTIVQQYAIVVTQDCDLLQDFDQRENGEAGSLNGVLFYEAQTAPDAKAAMPRGSDIWRRVYNNKDERYHFLEKVPADFDCLGQGIPELIIDFKRYFTVNPPEVYRQLSDADAKRRTRLEMPYREHLQARMAFYLQRVMLPRPGIRERPCRDAGVGAIAPGFAMLERAERASHIDPPASSYAIMQRASPYCGENPGPGKDVHGRA